MRIDIDIQNHSNKLNLNSIKLGELQEEKQKNIGEQKLPSNKIEKEIYKNQMQQAVDSINEILEVNNSELKFIFHEGLEEYFVQLVDTETEEVVREIPSKKILDIFYEMQKIVGNIIDEKI